jgi:hypothetical protein
MKKLILLFALFIACFWFYEVHADTLAICTPAPPNNAVLINESKCTVANGNPQMSVTVHVLVVTSANNKVYNLVKSTDKIGMTAVGTIPAGTQCNGTYRLTIAGVSYASVPRALATVTTTTKPSVLFAQCQ